MTLTLRQLQASFTRSILQREESPPLQAIIKEGVFPAAQRLQIYRNHTFASLTEILRVTYPVILKLVGDGFFSMMAAQFIAQHPPKQPCLNDYGADLAQFIRDFAPARTLPYLGFVADLEWTIDRFRRAEPTATLSPAVLVSVPPEQAGFIRFKFSGTCTLFSWPYPILKIWRVNQADSPESVDLDEGPSWCLAVGWDGDVTMHALSKTEFIFYENLMQGEVLAAAAENALSVNGALDIPAALQRLLTSGCISDFDISASGGGS